MITKNSKRNLIKTNRNFRLPPKNTTPANQKSTYLIVASILNRKPLKCPKKDRQTFG